MTREEQLIFCKKCLNRKMNMEQGLICNITGQKANFENECIDFKIDKTVKIVPLNDKEDLQTSEIKQLTSKEYFNMLTILFYAMIVGIVFFALISFFLQQNDFVFREIDIDVFNYIVPLFIVGGVIGGNLLFKNQLKEASSKKDLLEKLKHYRSALIVKYAFFESSAFFAIITYLLTGEILFLALAGIPILAFLLNIPSITKIGNNLNLNYDEKQKINKPETVLGEIKKIKNRKTKKRAIIIISIFALFLIGDFIRVVIHNQKLEANHRYTIGTITDIEIFARGNPVVSYEYQVNEELYEGENASGFAFGNEKVKIGLRIFVMYNPDDIENFPIALIDCFVPSRIKEAPTNGWECLPIRCKTDVGANGFNVNKTLQKDYIKCKKNKP